MIRDYLPKGDEITSHQPYLDAIAAELNERPRVLGFLTHEKHSSAYSWPILLPRVDTAQVSDPRETRHNLVEWQLLQCALPE